MATLLISVAACGGGESNSSATLKEADGVLAEQAREAAIPAAIGEAADLGGLLVDLRSVVVLTGSDGEDAGRIGLDLRVENPTKKEIPPADFNVVCPTTDDTGGWYIESTFDQSAVYPPETFREGQLILGVPKDCTDWYLRAALTGMFLGDTQPVIRWELPPDVLRQLESVTSSSAVTDSSAASTDATTTVAVETSASGVAATTEATGTGDETAALITLADLPSGWAIQPSEADSADGEADCGADVMTAAGLEAFESQPTAQSAFMQSDFGPFLGASILNAGDRANDVIATMPDALAACDGYVDSEGTTTRVTPVNFPSLGDETFATQMDFATPMFLVTTLVAYTRHGDLIVSVAHTVIGGSPDPALVEELLQTMLARL